MRYYVRRGEPVCAEQASNFEEALRLMEAALRDCPGDLWEKDLWPDEAPTGPTPHGGLHGSAPWFLAYHALLTLDYDLSAEFEPWAPPPPFDDLGSQQREPFSVTSGKQLLDNDGICL